MQTKRVTRNALLKRLGRYLRRVNNESLHTSRTDESSREFGVCYTTDNHSGNVCSRFVEPESLARELGLLRSNEAVVS